MNDVADVRTLTQRYIQCVMTDKGILPADSKVFEALAGAIVCDLRARQAIDVDGDKITANKTLDNVDEPLKFIYDLIKMQGTITFGDLATAIDENHPDRYNAFITEICTPLAADGAMTAAADVNGLNAYLADPEIISERIDHMMAVVMRTRANDPYDQGLAFLLDYVGVLDKLTDGKDQDKEFQHRLHKEENIGNLAGQSLKEKPAEGLLSQMVAIAGEITTIL